jgi:hypothetical protein
MRVPELLRIYIAGWFGAKDRLRLVRDRIHALGVGEVVSTWLDEETAAPEAVGINYVVGATPEQCREYAIRDMGEVRYSDLLILDTSDVNPRGGREVEYGLALANGLAVWIVGPRRNVFHYVAQRHFATWDEAIELLEVTK